MSSRKKKNENFLDTTGVVRELAERAKFTMADTKIILDHLEEIFKDCIEQGVDIDIRGFLHLYVQDIKPFKGVNAHLSRIRGETVFEEFPASKRASVRLGQNMRDLLRSPKKRKIKNSKATREAILNEEKEVEQKS